MLSVHSVIFQYLKLGETAAAVMNDSNYKLQVVQRIPGMLGKHDKDSYAIQSEFLRSTKNKWLYTGNSKQIQWMITKKTIQNIKRINFLMENVLDVFHRIQFKLTQRVCTEK